MSQARYGKMEVRTTRLFQGWCWKEGRNTQLWVRRYYVLVRREQIDEIMNASSDVLHELITFDTASEHAECLSSLELEEALSFDAGSDAGFPEHEKAERALKRLGSRRGSSGFGDRKRTLFSGLADLLAVKFSTDEIADYTLLLTFQDRQLRLRAETKSAFETWRALFAAVVPATACSPAHSGWLWRKRFGGWEQRYVIIHDGVLYFFVSYEECERFKQIASRGDDGIFIAAPIAEACIGLEFCEVVQHRTWEDRTNVLHFTVEDPPVSEMACAVDEAQATAWEFAVRNARHWFETIPDEHPTRKLFGGMGGDEDGPMLSSNQNPLALAASGVDLKALAEAEAAKKARMEAARARKEARRAARREAKKRNKRNARLKNGSSDLEQFMNESRGSQSPSNSSKGSRDGSPSSHDMSRANSTSELSRSGSGSNHKSKSRSSKSKSSSKKKKDRTNSGASFSPANSLMRRSLTVSTAGIDSPSRTLSNGSPSLSRRGSTAGFDRSSSSSSSSNNSANSLARTPSNSNSNPTVAPQRRPSLGSTVNTSNLSNNPLFNRNDRVLS